MTGSPLETTPLADQYIDAAALDARMLTMVGAVTLGLPGGDDRSYGSHPAEQIDTLLNIAEDYQLSFGQVMQSWAISENALRHSREEVESIG